MEIKTENKIKEIEELILYYQEKLPACFSDKVFCEDLGKIIENK